MPNHFHFCCWKGPHPFNDSVHNGLVPFLYNRTVKIKKYECIFFKDSVAHLLGHTLFLFHKLDRTCGNGFILVNLALFICDLDTHSDLSERANFIEANVININGINRFQVSFPIHGPNEHAVTFQLYLPLGYSIATLDFWKDAKFFCLAHLFHIGAFDGVEYGRNIRIDLYALVLKSSFEGPVCCGSSREVSRLHFHPGRFYAPDVHEIGPDCLCTAPGKIRSPCLFSKI